MELLLILTYSAICLAVFKIFRIPVNKWTLPTAVLGGTPIMPNVKGRVIEVPVEPNAPLKQGDILFKIDPQPYQYVVDQKKAQVAEAEQNVKQLKAAYDQALANVEKVNVQVKLAQEEYDRQAQLFEKKVVAQAALDIATRNIDAAKQGLAAAQAAAENARLAYESEIGGVNTTVVLDAIATGQFQATGVLQDMGADVPGGRAVAIINITDDTSSYNLPGGSAAQVALYTPYARHFAIIRRILLRMRSWENYVFLEGH